MAYTPTSDPKPIEIDTFLGLNESVGETEIELGEAVTMENFRITNNYKAQKRNGYEKLVDFSNALPVYGMWQGILNDKNIIVSVNDGKVYEYDIDLETNTQLGTITDVKTTIFWFNSKIYFLNGTDYKEYDGTTYQDVEPYIPTIYINAPPTGGGTAFESINLLTGSKKQTFIGDGASTTFQLVEEDVDSIDSVTVDGATATYTTDLTAGTFTITSGTPADESEVEAQWTKASPDSVLLVTNNKYAMDFGPGNDISVFLWGNEDQKNRRIWSGITEFGLSDAGYFPFENYTDIGTDQFAITDIVPQYDRQVVFKEDRTFYSYAEAITLADDSIKYTYPVYDLNEAVGNIAFDGVRLIENYPLSLKGNSVWKWTSSQVEDERNATIISDRIKLSLDDLDLTEAVTFDFQKQKEYWLNIGTNVYIWNYGADVWYTYTNIKGYSFLEYDTDVLIASDGAIYEYKKEYKEDDGTIIDAVMELGFTDFGVNQLLKNSKKMWVTIQPDNRTSLNLLWETDRKILDDNKALIAQYVLLDFNDIDFNQFSFLSNINPQSERFKIRAKKYQYIKFIFKNGKANEDLTILKLKVMAETTSEVK